MAIVPATTQNSPVSYFQEVLPEELLPNIFTQIDETGVVGSLMKTCWRFNKFISHCSDLWQSFVRSDFLYPFPHPLPFTQLYKGLKITQNNVKANNFQERDLSPNNVTEIAMHEGQLFYVSFEGVLQLWDVNSDKEIHTFSGHEDLTCFAMDGNYLATGSIDGTVKLWDLRTREELHTFSAPEAANSLSLNGDLLACGFVLGAIKIWNIKTKEEYSIMTDSDREITILSLQENWFVFNGSEGTKALDLATGQFRNLDLGWVNCFVMQGNTLYVANNMLEIVVCDFEANTVHTINSGLDYVGSLAVQGNLLFAANPNGTIKVWDVKNKKELQTFKDERGSVFSLAVNAGELFVSANDGSVKVYDFGAGSALTARSSSSVVHFPFLEELGIRSVKDHLEKLNCRPGHLQKIGIVTQEDLHRICTPYTASVDQIPSQADVSQDFLQKEKIAGRRKETLVEALKTMSNVLEEMTTEASNSSGVLYESECPWKDLQREINFLNDSIVKGCLGDRKQTVKAFDAENYNRMASQLNALIQKFNQEVPALHREHQVKKLRAYVDQCAVSEAVN